jgi:hypothetical protein
MNKRKRNIKLAIAWIVMLIASGLAYYYYGWKLVLILFLFTWGNNIEREVKFVTDLFDFLQNYKTKKDDYVDQERG